MSRSAVLAPALLLAYGLAFAWTALGRGLIANDDHPGQIYRLWHVVTLGPAPWRWNPGWWAGYAELQFYPPGFAYAGALLHWATLGWLTPGAAYQSLLWIVYLLPGLSTYALLQRVLASPWLALPGAFMALAICAESRSGVEEGLRWGLVAARLGWGLLPLLALSLIGWVEGKPRAVLGPVVLLALVIITHPAHVPAALLMVALAGALAPGRAGRRARAVAVVLGLGVGLTAFWLVPLAAHLSLTLPLAWADASPASFGRRALDYPLLGILLAASAGAWVWLGRHASTQRGWLWLAALAPLLFAVVALDALVARPLGFLWLPADRIADSLLLALILGASLGLAALARALPALPVWLPAGGALALAVALSAGRSEPTLFLWPRPAQWPTYAEVARGIRFDDLARTLAEAPAGRVLFVRSAVPLAYRSEWWRPHSHITALVPVTTGREILNGTFTHPSPVAGFVYSGSASAPVTRLVEQRDGITLFGQELETIRPEAFERVAASLRISVVVALDEDAPRLAFLDRSESFGRARAVGPFLVFVARLPRMGPEAAGAGRLRLRGPSEGSSSWLETGIAFSPLWHAESAGRSLRTRRDEIGLLEVERARGDVELSYRPGLAEWTGLAISVVAAALLGLAATRRRRAE